MPRKKSFYGSDFNAALWLPNSRFRYPHQKIPSPLYFFLPKSNHTIMSASQVILRRGPDYPRPESLHYKSMDLSTEWPSSHPKPDLIKSHNDAPKEPCSCDMDYTERLQRSDFEFLTTLGYAEVSSRAVAYPDICSPIYDVVLELLQGSGW